MKYTASIYSEEILKDINKYKIIISEKEKNINFLKEYCIKDDERKNKIYSLNKKCFVEKIINKDNRIKSKYLYIFSPMYFLTTSYGKEELVKLYIKICRIDDYIYVESFHKDSDY